MSVLIKRAPAEDTVYCFITKKRQEGKPFFICMTAGANKFLHIYFARVREHLATL